MTKAVQISRLTSQSIPFKEEFKITYTRENYESFDEETKKNCRILEFSREWSLREILIIISKLEPEIYENLFIFIIEDRNFELSRKDVQKVPRIVELLFEFLIEFSGIYKPILLQIKSQTQNLTKVYFKENNCAKFIDIHPKSIGKSENFEDFSSFIWLFKNEMCQNFEDLVIQRLPKVKHSEIIMHFLQTLDLPEEFYDKLVLKCAAEGSKSDLLTAINAKCDDKGKIVNLSAQNYLTYSFNDTSVLTTANRHSNKEIVHFIMKNCSDLVQKLPYEDQVEASTAANEMEQPGILFDLLQRSDFPFPKDFNTKIVTDKRICKVVEDRASFYNAIAKEDKDAISNFIKNNPNLKFAYDPSNETVLNNALRLKKFESFFLLKSHGFRAVEFDHFREEINEDKEKREANKFARLQRIENVKISLADKNKAVMLLATRTFIYTRQDAKENEKECRNKIKNWYKNIYNIKFGPQLLEAASQCENLKIIFDFECDSVENVDVSASSATLGSTYPISKWIFVGAKSAGSEKREQQIKGVIAHEICHYVMRLVYQNNENPYYKDGDEDCQRFDAIVTEIEQMLFPRKVQEEREQENEANEDVEVNESGEEEGDEGIEQVRVEDECADIISTVYTCYNRKDYHPELIVRPVHIYAQFDDDEAKTAYIEEKYKILFDFFERFVIPELEKFNFKQREKVKKFNDFVGVLFEIENLEYEFSSLKDITSLIDHHLVIITTNVPKLLLLNVYKHLDQFRKNLLEDQNIFITPKITKNPHILKEFETIVNQKVNLNIFIDCSKGIGCKIKNLIVNESSSFIFIVTNEKEKDLIKNLEHNELKPSVKAINYEWNDLAVESQKSLLQTEINFQDNQVSLFELLSNQTDPEKQQETETFEEFAEVIDGNCMNLFINQTEINVNIEVDEANDFDVLYRPRNFITNQQQNQAESESTSENLITKYSEKQMLSEFTNKKYILFSDKAVAGKSSTLNNMLLLIREQYPKNWVSFIDLRKFVSEIKLNGEITDIIIFLSTKILKQSSIEGNIFKRLYENGKVCILFDEFDKSAPDCFEIMTKMFRTFDFNGGNQLWIVARDFCEAILKEKLELDVTYKLEAFSEQDGVDLIATSWVLNEMESIHDTQSRNEITNQVKSSQNFVKYKENAKIIVRKILTADNCSIGSPQFYRIIAEIFKGNKSCHIDCTLLKVYGEFVKIQYEKWFNKNIERIRSQKKQSKYHKLHQTIAMQGSFPEDSSFIDINLKDLGWSDEEIIDCGFLNKIGEIFVFSYDTFRDYFIADYVIRILKKKGRKVEDDFCICLIQILTLQKFKIVRLFLNEAFCDPSIWKCIEHKKEDLAKTIYEHSDKLLNLSQIIEENNEHIVNFVMSIFQSGISENICKILSNNVDIFYPHEKPSKLSSKFQNFVISLLSTDDLKKLIQIILLKICDSNLDIEVAKKLLKIFEERKGSEFIKEAIKLQDEKGRNLVHKFVVNYDTNAQKFQTFIKVMESLLEKAEIVELLEQSDNNGFNVIQICYTENKKETLKYLLKELKRLFIEYNSLQKFKELCAQNTAKSNETILYFAPPRDDAQFHEILWELMLDDFKAHEELENLMTQKDENLNDFAHSLIISGKLNLIQHTFKKFISMLSHTQYQEILKSKDSRGRNLIQLAACYLNDIETHKILWKIYQELWVSDEEFLEILKEVDKNGDNFLSIAACSSTMEVLAFYIEELEKIMSLEEIKKHFITLKFIKTISLEMEAKHKKSSKWEVIEKYLTTQDQDQEVSNVVDHDIKSCTIRTSYTEKQKNIKTDVIWNVMKNLFISEHFTQEFVRLFRMKASKNLLSVYQNLDNIAKNYDEIEFHETLWELLLTTFENREELKNLLIRKYENDINFIHILVANAQVDIIEFTFKQIKENFSENQYEEMLKLKGPVGRNLLQTAICESKEIKVFKVIWVIARASWKSNDMFLEMVYEKDSENNNIFHVAACFTTSEIFEFMIKEFEKVLDFTEMKYFLSRLGFQRRNLLRGAVTQNTDPDLHKSMWKVIRKYFHVLEILEMVRSTKFRSNLYFDAVYYNSKAVIEIVFNEIDKTLENSENFRLNDYLKSVNYKGLNILHVCADSKNEEKLEFLCSKLKECLKYEEFKELLCQRIFKKNQNVLHIAAFCYNIKLHFTLWKYLLNIFENREELTSLISQKDKDDYNFLHLLIIYNNEETIEFVFKQIKENLGDAEYRQIITSRGNGDRNLLQLACKSPNITKHMYLWNALQDVCTKEEFLKMLTEVDIQRCNVFHLAARYTTSIVFEYMVDELEALSSRSEKHQDQMEIKKILGSLDIANRNVLQAAAIDNKSRKSYDILWETIQKYFNHREICDMIMHTDVNGENLLFISAHWSTLDIVESTCYKIKEYIQKTEDSSLIAFLSCLNNNGENILHILAKTNNSEKLKFLWQEIEHYFKFHARSRDFKELIRQKSTKNNLNALHFCVSHNNIEFLEALWYLLLETFGSLENLENFMFPEDEIENNFVDFFTRLVNADLVQIGIISLLQKVASQTINPERYKILWTASRNACKNDNKFLQILQDQKILSNVFNAVLNFTIVDIIEFIIKELEEITTRDQIKSILGKLDYSRQNYMQKAIIYRKSPQFCESLWKVYDTYFTSSEIADIINNSDDSGKNILFNAIGCRSKEIVVLTWNQIKNRLKNDGNSLKKCLTGTSEQNILHVLVNTQDEHILKYMWEELAELCTFRDIFSSKISNQKHNVLQMTAFCDRMEFQKTFWELLLNTFENREELVRLIIQKDVNENNFVHLVVAYSETNLIEFVFETIKENFNVNLYRAILKLKGRFGKSLLHLAASHSKKIETFLFLCRIFRNICNTDNEFLRNFTEVDNQNNNILHLAVCFSTSIIFELLINELKQLTTDENIRIILNTLGFAQQNLLQKAARQNTSLEMHKSLWKIIRQYLSSTEIFEMINHSDEYGYNLLLSTAECNSKEIFQFTWKNIKIFIDKREDQVEYLKSTGHSEKNLHDLCLENRVDIIDMRICIQNLLLEYKDDPYYN